MQRGVKLDLDVGSRWDEGWHQVDEVAAKPKAELLEPSKHQLFFKKEKRRGKIVTLAGPLHVSDDDAKALLKTLKAALGCGGTLKAEWMEFQGDIAPKLRELLEARHYRFKH